MPAGRELHTPTHPGSVSRVPTIPTEYISPSTRRHATLTHSPLLAGITNENDDEAEKRARRRSKVMEMQRTNLNSPGTPSDRRRSAPLSGLTNAQLTDHYANCIKLSCENKINAKNAFGLHLIDYMSEYLKKKEMTNFQVASSTLDASAKIYAGRVDAVHTETYKMLSGLGRGSDEKNQDGDAGEGENEEEPGQNNKKRKRARRSQPVEENLDKISIKKFDLEFEVDPLFHKTSAAFDEGGTSGLLLNHLRCLDDTSELVLDSNTILTNVDTPCNQGSPVDLGELKDVYQGVNLNSLQICPAFSEFEFTNWNSSEQDVFSQMLEQVGRSNHAFDMHADVEPVPCAQAVDMTMVDVPDDGFGDVNDDIDDAVSEAAFSTSTQSSETTMYAGDGKEAKLVESALNDIKHGTVGALLQVLAAEPGEYSYFNADLLRTWAGPAHWRLRPQSKDPKIINGSNNVNKKPKEKKQAFKLDFSETVDFDAFFKRTRASTTLSKSTLDKHSKGQTTLPEDLHYQAEKLFRLFVKPKVMVKRQTTTSQDLDEGIDNYDYDNANDRENYCPGVEGGHDDDDETAGGFNITHEFSQLSNDLSQGSFVANDSVLNGTLLAGDNLVAQPNKVAKIDIAYAKTAKKMDVKRLKNSIWNMLCGPAEENKENQGGQQQEKEHIQEKHVNGVHSFQSLLQELPQNVSKGMAKNLSVPIAFVCLLHLANEKTLKICSDSSMADLEIAQGV